MAWRAWERLQAQLRREWGDLTTVQHSDRRWPMPFCAALATGLPLLAGAAWGRIDLALTASLGGLTFLYLPETALAHRMRRMSAAVLAMSACFALGLLGHFLPGLQVLLLTGVAIVVSILCRYWRLAPPGSLFFIMAAAIGAYSPVPDTGLALQLGLFALGGLQALLIAFAYSLNVLRTKPALAVDPLPAIRFDVTIFDPLVIGLSVGLSLLLAQLLQLDRPYWVAVSCLAVIQGASLRAVWTRQMHRIVGTGLGLLLAGVLLALPLDPWRIALLMMILAFVIEMLVVRHYGLATVFITPLTLLLAEAPQLGLGSPDGLLQARLIDTVLGCLVGLAGGLALHSPGFRNVFGPPLRRWLPERFRH